VASVALVITVERPRRAKEPEPVLEAAA
jgi:hypothetical protein